MLVLDGRPVRDAVLADLAAKVREAPRPPSLAVVLVGEDPASQVYVRNKEKACAEVGFLHQTHRLPADALQSAVLDLVDRLNRDPGVDGILIQMPLPAALDAESVLQAVRPDKDVDGFHPQNLGRLVGGRPGTVACTPRGVLRLLDHYGVTIPGRRVVVVGRSVIVGRPLALLFNLKGRCGDATVTMCHSRTPDLESVTRQAEILVAAIGVPEFLRRRHIALGAVVVDVGMNRVADPGARKGYRLVGDVAAAEMAGHAGALTPVPGGVGPMTIAMLLENTWEAMVRRREHGDA
ncbi:MAG TPA: bifunctional methylenetetrahydrofolate dehydrogenase/methenyltetrahydrofolate cyclohydrolase FolD [Candidatus Krumholzibacteria bacterium]|nr:bifunctional methylenetetrahydrofolate dehydrogenase/methenyltetrahydrofolate cyclohydrolase FolD [Candidatus Krumholzibacteria bacterium]HPD71519.1 bifunctional methylenetetrahydrofolate dehydrogenase/methenyltetrahydrofolate cyclohydrolase FolD [Candidatus Krumholzibacteria bacterium]HRY41548.1 bifunctional methylenetetrahydrofolate dehydrogenase/methenyltetrahydrofolate cyclohydrolase FolD [Candidatus Krumholzibacteria bacterium]